jgi:hypothetical protein
VLSAPAAAEVAPGDVIDAKDAGRVKGLVSPGVEQLVRRGMGMKIIPYQPTADPPAFRAATEKYSAQVKLRPDGYLDESTYVAGRPFPVIDPNDPQAAIKVMYDFERSRYATDDLTARLLDAESGDTTHGGLKIERHFVVETLRMLKYIGRTEQPPIPAMPNPDGFLIKAAQYRSSSPSISRASAASSTAISIPRSRRRRGCTRPRCGA